MQTTPPERDWSRLSEYAKADVEEAIEELRDIISKNDPLELISRAAVFILTSHPEKPKDSGGPRHSETNLEYLVSFATAHPRSLVRGVPSPDVVQRAIELLTVIHMASSWHYKFKRRTNRASRSALESIADSFRSDKLHVRGDGYWLHLKQTIRDLLQPHDPKLKASLGFTSEEYLNFMERSENELNRQLLAEAATHLDPFMKLYRPWLRGGADDENQLDEEGWRQYVAEHEIEVAETKARFDAFGSPEAFLFDPLSKAEEHILKALSCTIGDNRLFHGTKPEHAFWPLTPSATDFRPIVHHEGKFYGFNLPKLSREAYTLIGDLLREADAFYWRNTFLKQRDDYLEEEVAKLFQQALPSAQVLDPLPKFSAETRIMTCTDVCVCNSDGSHAPTSFRM